MADISQPVGMTNEQIANLDAVCKQYGINWDGTYRTSDLGNDQGNIQLKIKQGGYSWSVTYNPKNPESYDNVFTYKFGTWDPQSGYYQPPKDEKSNYTGLEDYYLTDTTHNHTAFIGSTAAVLPDGAQAAIMSAISGNDNQRLYVDSGSSAATFSLGDVAKSQVDSAKGIFYMPIEPAGYNNDGKPGRLMASNIVENSSSIEGLKDKTIGLLALEGAGNIITQKPEDAVPYYSEIANDTEMPVYMMVDPTKGEHALKDSPEVYLANGFVDNVFDALNGEISVSSDENSEENNEGVVSISASTNKLDNTSLNLYKIEGREDWKAITLGSASGAMISITSEEFIEALSGSADIDFTIDFESVMENTALMGKSITNTSLSDRTDQPCTSKANFPNSLNEGCSYLYGSSRNLLHKMARDIQSFERIAAILQHVDENELISLMNSTIGTDNSLGYGLEVQNLAFIDDGKNSYPYVFSNLLSSGIVGSITMNDIDSILQGNTLIGSIGTGLNDEIDEATRMLTDIASMKEHTQMTGPIWDLMCQRLDTYSLCCNARINVATHIQETYVLALNKIKDYYNETAALLAGSKINMNGALDDSQIPVCEATIVQLKQDIINLQAEYAECEAVPKLRGTGEFWTDEKGEKHEIMEPNEPQYTNAQNRMKEIKNVDIPEKEADIAYNNTYIERLQGVAELMNNVNDTVQQAIDYATAEYVNIVNDIEPLNVPDFASI